MGVKVKICGITNSQQALMVQDAGADALGLVLYQGSSRFVNLESGTIDIEFLSK